MTRPDIVEPLKDRFQRGDRAAFEELFDRYSRPMFATALSMLGNRDLAAETVQEAFIKIWQAAGSYDTARDIEPWLFTITRRTAMDLYRKHRRGSETVAIDFVADSRLAVGPPSMEKPWLTWQVTRAMARLSSQEREVLYLAYFHEMTQSEISQALGIPMGTVKSRTFRAQRRLAELLEHVVDPPVEAAATA
ncbi:RNA polymerase sigma factor [Thermoactinospora rubra]|uniref:RNA polymerase sigma factor n=1 Tax=Thermoactinospora rubra TaxID=1088767 RepID=UPI000A11A5CB|nr:sigma-70 family RNA polymerase sigma factor [Thermoactinospora rubra]